MLGEIGDRRAIGGLLKIAANKHAKRQTRERALGALGLMARETDRGWTFGIRRGYNFRLATPVMRQVMAIF